MNSPDEQDKANSEPIQKQESGQNKAAVSQSNKDRQLKVILRVATAIAVVALIAIVMKKPGAKTYGQVGSYKVTQAELDKLARVVPTSSKDDLVTLLLDLNLYRQAAATAGVKLTQLEVASEYAKRTGGKVVSYKDYLMHKVEIDLLKQKLTARIPGNTQGRIITIHFDQHLFVFGPPDLGPGETEAMRPQYIAADRAAADALKDNIYKQLQDKKINFDQAMQLEKSDPKLGDKALPTSFHSQAFNTSDPKGALRGLLAQSDLKQVVDSTPLGGYSKPTVIKLQLTEKKLEDGIYVIVQADSRPKKLADSLDAFITAQKQQLNYKKTL